MLQNNIYKNNYITELCNYISTYFDTAYLYRKIDSLANIIRPYVYADPQKFYTNSQFEMNINSNITVGSFNTPGLKLFIMNRRNSVVSQLALNSCILGISEWTNGYDFQTYPNPCQSEFYLSLPDNFNYPEFKFEIKDMTGKEVKSTHINVTNDKVIRMNIQELESGIYFYSIEVTSDKKVFTGKLVVIK